MLGILSEKSKEVIIICHTDHGHILGSKKDYKEKNLGMVTGLMDLLNQQPNQKNETQIERFGKNPKRFQMIPMMFPVEISTRNYGVIGNRVNLYGD